MEPVFDEAVDGQNVVIVEPPELDGHPFRTSFDEGAILITGYFPHHPDRFAVVGECKGDFNVGTFLDPVFFDGEKQAAATDIAGLNVHSFPLNGQTDIQINVQTPVVSFFGF